MINARPVINILSLSRFPIYNQLVLEEAILRGTTENWCIINDGAFCPAIVMGISGRASELIQVPEAIKAGVQVVKRFTGGGTVVVDHDTIFTTLIVQGQSLPHVDPYPQPIMKWTEGFYEPVFKSFGEFRLKENDYVFQQQKFGGNAQAITGKRWLHHTSFLWDYRAESMNLLKQPKKAPAYREGRSHEHFIVRLKDFVSERSAITEGIIEACSKSGFIPEVRNLTDAAKALQGSNKICGTKLVDLTTALQQ
ncbi:hypothetical protein CEUSTIGMA_g8451.t1 [Chlamydomonas eustigma]|uniref:BPL/LPL catalytic domain-containing protein n=1 Tax=Chlamydomonas eustigma TaxID=1157962 RepID=A0A250XD82_9CHLO|nr:hypothetical protein CEUSTIGMA_g8451.t1 [Chlamydomonas eustigma]|eukprot:GAX81016.1 hypothetical protein CEUSTIGMA_g8451.t1 [Chlamydomonas eustigma]